MKYALLFLLAVLVAPSYGQAEPIGAEVVYITGKVYRETPSGRVAVIKGDRFAEGEKIITADGQVEVRLDNGNLIKIDRNSELRIEALRRNKKGSTKSIFSLIFGRVKSKVFKLFDSASVFEYHTKAAVAGVSGTPPFIVEHSRETDKTTVDLLGKVGEEGSVYVKGFDSAKTVVMLLSGFSTSVLPGESPVEPYRTPKARFEQLNKVIDFVTLIKESRAGRDGSGDMQMRSAFTARDIAINTMAKKVTVVTPTTADEGGSVKEADNRAEPNSPTAGVGSVSSSNDAIGGSSSGTPSTPPPPPVTNTDVDVTVVIK